MPDTKSPFSMEGFKLIALGFTTLFLELVLIRYMGANIWNMGYFPNLVLIAVFLGMGLGFVFHQLVPDKYSPMLVHLSFFLLMFLVMFVYYFHPSLPGINEKQTTIAGEIFFLYSPLEGEDTKLGPFILIFTLVVLIFILFSQRTAKVFSQFSPLMAYTLDITGSCLGILSFMVVSFLQLSPMFWFAILLLLFLAAQGDSWKTRWILILPVVVILSYSYTFDSRHLRFPELSENTEVAWSPYQRVSLVNNPKLPYSMQATIWVNGNPHQRIDDYNHLKDAPYHIPYIDREKAGLPAPENVLIIGSGSGNDTACALMHNPKHVDAVEIDPAIASFGKKYHPLQPYADPRVNLVINDGRAFMANTKRKYDIIVIAWADSYVRASSMAQLRLENYLYTKEAMERGYKLLSDTGTMYVFNTFSRTSIGLKFLGMIQQGTGISPIIISESKGHFHKFKFGKLPQFRTNMPPVPNTVDIPIDDWPFLHLIKRSIPSFYMRAMIAMAIFISILLMIIHFATGRLSNVSMPGSNYTKIAFALMGAAFLLLETKSIIQFALLFGTTWINNSLVFLGVLVLVLAANWSAYLLRGKAAVPWIFFLLIISSLLPLLYPLGNLLSIESVAVRFIFASLLTFSPIYFANLIFSVTFRDQAVPAHMFGWNLIGAMMGGVLEYTSMLLGYNRLALLVAILYFFTFVFLLIAKGQRDKSKVQPTVEQA